MAAWGQWRCRVIALPVCAKSLTRSRDSPNDKPISVLRKSLIFPFWLLGNTVKYLQLWWLCELQLADRRQCSKTTSETPWWRATRIIRLIRGFTNELQFMSMLSSNIRVQFSACSQRRRISFLKNSSGVFHWLSFKLWSEQSIPSTYSPHFLLRNSFSVSSLFHSAEKYLNLRLSFFLPFKLLRHIWEAVKLFPLDVLPTIKWWNANLFPGGNLTRKLPGWSEMFISVTNLFCMCSLHLKYLEWFFSLTQSVFKPWKTSSACNRDNSNLSLNSGVLKLSRFSTQTRRSFLILGCQYTGVSVFPSIRWHRTLFSGSSDSVSIY